MYSSTFEKYHKASRDFGEKNDCAVRALAIAGNLEYPEAHAYFAKVGRKDRKATLLTDIHKANELAGFTLHRVYNIHTNPDNNAINPKHTRSFTSGNVAQQLPNGTYYVVTEKHIFTVINKVAHDWMINRKFKVWYIYAVHSTKQAPKPEVKVMPAPATPARQGTVKQLIFHVADVFYKNAGQPTSIKEVRKLRITIMDRLETEYGIKRSTASNMLGEWQKTKNVK